MEPTYLLAILCYYGPTPLAGLLAGWQAIQCKSPWQAFAVGLVGTIALAVVFGVAADYLPLWEVGWSFGRVWLFHLKFSPILALPLGFGCAAWVSKRNAPPPEP
jgi:hypothetical protein